MIHASNRTHTNPQWNQIEIPYEGSTFVFPYHIPTGEVYNFDPPSLVRFKCVIVTGATPVISIARSVYWLAKSILLSISEAFRYLDGQNVSQEDRNAIIVAASDSLRSIKYGFLLTCSSFKGIFDPLNGRQEYGRLERELNRHTDGPHRDKFYLAFCFQRCCTKPKEDSKTIEMIQKLTKYIATVFEIRTAICTCDYKKLMKEFKLITKTAQ